MITVDDTTKLVGGAIVSETDGGLDLVTGDLVVEDVAINDYARDEYTGGQVNVNIGGIINGDIDHSNDTKKDDLFNENKYGSIEHSDAGHDKQGVVKGTISGGSVTVGGERDEDGNVIGGEILDVAALEDMGINTDADNIVTITKDESWEESFKVDLINVGVVAEQVDNLVNVVESFTAKVPDHVKAMGGSAEDLYRKAIANGMEKDNLEALTQTEGFQNAVDFRNRLESQYEKGEVTAEYIYTQMAVEAKAFADGYIAKNCASGTAEICDKLLNIYGEGKTAGELTSDDIFALMQAIEASTMAGDSVDDEGNRLWGSTLMQAAADCSALWYKDLRTREGDMAADQKIKDDIQSGQFQEMLEKSGVDPVQYLVDTGFDFKLTKDDEVYGQIKDIMNKDFNMPDYGTEIYKGVNLSTSHQAKEFLKLITETSSDGSFILDSAGNYILDEEKYKQTVINMANIANEEGGIDIGTWEAFSAALYQAGVREDRYYENQIVEQYINSGIEAPIYSTEAGDIVTFPSSLNNLYGTSPLFGVIVLPAQFSSDNRLGQTSNLFDNQDKITMFPDNTFVLGDMNIKENSSYKILYNINSSTSQQYATIAHEQGHLYQYDNIYKMLEYGRNPDGSLILNEENCKQDCLGVLTQYVNIKRSDNYTNSQIAAWDPIKNEMSSNYILPYTVSPLEYVLPSNSSNDIRRKVPIILIDKGVLK